MKKTYLYVLPLALIMGAYSGNSAAEDSGDNECTGDPQAPAITLNVKSGKANPECARVHLGSTIVFRIKPNKDLDSKLVQIEPKNPLDSWLTGDNKQIKDLIIIKVPGERDSDSNELEPTEHNYIIKIDGVEQDPRIKVEH